MKRYDILALVELSEEVPRPKVKGVASGYSPQHKFRQVEYLASGVHTYPGDKVIYLGEAVVARIKFASWEFFGNDVKVGDVFEIRELDRVVGVGVVKEIF
ncbi:hypothetical protein [Pseudomonas aeruginosa]|uniref:hypothetical protein n=1 Tax=Pseudomonas aeruginosa TaxID=287 RepID=UPI000F61AC26|nr:hypothetical protein [Pseudomonas aeruginosa]RRI34983.1 hypothetical protein EIM13_00985 [Pseudomonas aeruginosa]